MRVGRRSSLAYPSSRTFENLRKTLEEGLATKRHDLRQHLTQGTHIYRSSFQGGKDGRIRAQRLLGDGDLSVSALRRARAIEFEPDDLSYLPHPCGVGLPVDRARSGRREELFRLLFERHT